MSNEETKQDYVMSYLKMRKMIGWLGVLLPFILLFGNYTINGLDILNNNNLVKTECYTALPAESMCGQCKNNSEDSVRYLSSIRINMQVQMNSNTKDTTCALNIKPRLQQEYKNKGSWKSSISHYYYTTVGELFTGVLCAVALFMFCYKGYPVKQGEKGLSDNFMANAAGVFALGVVIFPTSSDCCITDNIRTFVSSNTTGYIHFTCAALFFITLAFMSIINFRRTENAADFGKGNNSLLYLICGIAMLACLLLIFIYAKFFEGKTNSLNALHPVFSLEALALIAFGISWLTKGKVDYYYVFRKIGLKKRNAD